MSGAVRRKKAKKTNAGENPAKEIWVGQLSTVDRAFRRLKPRARSADRFGATVERRGASRPYLPRDVVDGQVEVGAEHLEGEALGLASAAFLRGRGRMMSVPALESGRVARRGGRRARRGARSPNRRKHFPRGSRFSRGVPEKADGMDAPRTRRNDRGERDSRRSSACRAPQTSPPREASPCTGFKTRYVVSL